MIGLSLEALRHQSALNSAIGMNFRIYALFGLVNVAIGLAGKDVIGENEEII